MTHGDVTNTLVAAASYGEGRIVVFSSESLTNVFILHRHNKLFNDNIVKWVTKSPDLKREDVNVIHIEKMTNFEDVRKLFNDKPTIIGWRGDTARNEKFMKSLSTWIRKGGSFVCGVTPWAWARRGRKCQQIPIFCLLKVNHYSSEQARIRSWRTSRRHHVFTARRRSCSKVMFLHVFVRPGGRGSAIPIYPPDRTL